MLHTELADYDAALECFERVARLDRSNADALYRAGTLALTRRQDTAYAEDAFRAALEVCMSRWVSLCGLRLCVSSVLCLCAGEPKSRGESVAVRLATC